LKTKEDILENDGGNQTVIAIDWLPYCVFILPTYYGSQRVPSTVGLPAIRFCVQQKTESHTGLEPLESE